ncbi:P-loop containing nucleoside triphosphate hydrolase protein [Tricharina praecox]|uniref:P-loop containing nucleoside triphosphate hydrolase protein n=1 Tax=Tricharina praecox TaxID=43433 RepID=UPI0022208DF6|nr:P-loop containing nucleoside triphosphate hydrolase protein [Tricharina praecox]KAI5855916.1 P-loop containing nucleoside triphosphate hydrolase protein [Tricharina praecox]
MVKSSVGSNLYTYDAAPTVPPISAKPDQRLLINNQLPGQLLVSTPSSTLTTMASPTTFIVGLSGLSSTGKTTLSRLLRSLIPSSFILHQDDFYHPDGAIPLHAGGLQDWDCAGSINWEYLCRVLDSVHEFGALPADLKSLQDDSPVGAEPEQKLVSPETMRRLKKRLDDNIRADVRVAILDGFLMLHRDSPVEERMDVKVLLRVPHETAKQRREARNGYVTIEGFWTDPPGYFDKIVWPNYVDEHKYLFVDGDVEGRLTSEAEEKRRIHTPESLDASMEETLEWAVNILISELKLKLASASSPSSL